MKRIELRKVLDIIKNDYYVKCYRALKGLSDIYGYYDGALNFVLGICAVLLIDNLITESQVGEILDATKEYMDKKSFKRLDALFDEIRKGGCAHEKNQTRIRA